jgi:hypothetical protein
MNITGVRRVAAVMLTSGTLFTLAACGSTVPTESAEPTSAAATTAPATPSSTVTTIAPRTTTQSSTTASSQVGTGLRIYVSSTEDPVTAGTQIMPGKWKLASRPASGSQWAMVSIIDGKSVGTKATASDQGSYVALAKSETRTFSDPTFLPQVLGYDAPITLNAGDTLIPDASSPDWIWSGT